MARVSAKVFRKVFVRDVALVQDAAAGGGGAAETETARGCARGGCATTRTRADGPSGLPGMQRNSRVEVSGVVVEVEHKPRATFFSGADSREAFRRATRADPRDSRPLMDARPPARPVCAVDDGTGCILCVLWLPPPAEQPSGSAPFGDAGPRAHKLRLNAAAAEGREEVVRSMRSRAKLGCVVRVQGVASVYRGSLQLRVDSMRASSSSPPAAHARTCAHGCRLTHALTRSLTRSARTTRAESFIDPDAEARWWIETIELGREVYGFVPD